MMLDNPLKFIKPEEMTAVLSGKQTYIAKIYDGYWSSLKCGDVITFMDGTLDLARRTLINSCTVEVIGIEHFDNFGDAWFVHDATLFTNNHFVSRNEVNAHFRTLYTATDIKDHGVVVINFKLL